jgi:hypothetical protein
VTRFARLALIGAASVLAWSAIQAWRTHDVPDRMLEDRVAGVTNAEGDSHEGYALARLLVAVEKDPFQADRRRPGQRYRAAADLANTPAPARDTTPPVELIGTAVSPDGGFAVCALNGSGPRIVRVGQRLGDWTLSRVTKGAAEFATSSGTTIVVRVAKGGT